MTSVGPLRLSDRGRTNVCSRRSASQPPSSLSSASLRTSELRRAGNGPPRALLLLRLTSPSSSNGAAERSSAEADGDVDDEGEESRIEAKPMDDVNRRYFGESWSGDR